MSRFHYFSSGGVSVMTPANSYDLFEIDGVDDKPIRLCGFTLGQSTELGDAQEEVINLILARLIGLSASGNGTTAITSPADDTETALANTTKINSSTVATATTFKGLLYYSWNIRNTPYEVWLPEPFRPVIRQTQAIVLRQIDGNVADNVSVSVNMYVEEL